MKEVVDLEMKNVVVLRICPTHFSGVVPAVERGAQCELGVMQDCLEIQGVLTTAVFSNWSQTGQMLGESQMFLL